jgi:hypothetical protein
MSRHPIAIILAVVLALGTTEGMAYWWMHPAPAGLGQPVLCYRPKMEDRELRIEDGTSTPGSSSRDPASDSCSSAYTFLPEVVARSQPSLHCSTGTAARIDLDDDVTIHLAFFEWDLADSTNVLEAYRHLPDDCMGSIGMKLIEYRPSRSYQVGKETLTFDHTVFRDPRGTIIHAFKGTWVSGASGLLGNGLRGGKDQWRQLRWRSALKRFRPAYARVAQGAVRGIPNPNAAWQAFENAVLADLSFAR